MALIIPYFIHHRGCPHRCLFCNQHGIAGANQDDSNDPVADLVQTIERWLARSRQQEQVQVAFFGGSFTCLDEMLQLELLKAVAPHIESKRVDSIRLSTRPDCLSAEIVDFLVSGGVSTIEIGAQSMNDRVLKQAGRGHTSAQVETAVELLAGKGVETGIQLMAGLPGETTRSFLDGVRKVVEMSPNLVRLYPTLVLKNTELAALYEQSTWRPLSLERAVSLIARARTMLVSNGIKVIRMGLQPTVELETQLIAGPYHPAFGELVNARCWYKKIRPLLVKAGRGKMVRLTLSDKDYSALTGLKKQNLRRLQGLAHGARLHVETDPGVERGTYRYTVN